MSEQQKGIVYFVGAGPGDPELITVKGMRLLKELTWCFMRIPCQCGTA